MAYGNIKLTVDLSNLNAITQLTCLKSRCINNQVAHGGAFACNLKKLWIDENGKCTKMETVKESK